MAGWSDAVVCAAVTAAVLWHLRARRRWRRRSVRLALRNADPEIRRAAVLVAISDGVRNYVHPLCDLARNETHETVLEALALVAEGGRGKLGRRRRATRLLVWAEARASLRTAADDVRPARPQLPPPWLHLIDALELMDGPTPAALPQPSSESALEAVNGRWRASTRCIDALEVVDVVARCTSTSAAGDSPVRRRKAARGVWRAGPNGIDALLAADLTGYDDQHRPARRRRTKEPSAASANS